MHLVITDVEMGLVIVTGPVTFVNSYSVCSISYTNLSRRTGDGDGLRGRGAVGGAAVGDDGGLRAEGGESGNNLSHVDLAGAVGWWAPRAGVTTPRTRITAVAPGGRGSQPRERGMSTASRLRSTNAAGSLSRAGRLGQRVLDPRPGTVPPSSAGARASGEEAGAGPPTARPARRTARYLSRLWLLPP